MGKYDNLFKDLINRAKFKGEFAIAESFSNLIFENIWIKNKIFVPSPDFIIPVPCDSRRYQERGYHIPNLICKHLSTKIEVPILNLVKKERSTMSQIKLDLENRKNNLKDAFVLDNINQFNLSKCDILWIIDDLVTTGSTVFECAKVINQNYPFLDIYVIGIAGE